MKKIIMLLLSLMMVLSLTACASKEEENTSVALTDGSYTAEVKGHNGAMKVNVEIAEGKIASVNVDEQVETYGIGYGLPTAPVEEIPSQIVEYQSLGVDYVTGATVTSAAIVSAVSDCITQAGGDPATYKAVKASAENSDTVLDADVAVIGAGAAGMAAAIEASNAGAKVVVLEKQGIIGGSTTRSGGKLVAAGTKYQEAQGFTGDTADDLFAYFKSVGGDKINDEKLKEFTDNALDDVNWLEDMGVNIINVEPIHSSITPWRVMNTYGGGGQVSGIGGQITVPMYNAMAKTDTEVCYGVTANEILTKDGAVSGVKGTRKDGTTVTVNAPAVIICTGGYAASEEYTEHLGMGKVVTNVPAGNVGDGIKMAEKVGAKVEFTNGIQEVLVSFTCGVGINEESGLIVTESGERFVNEYTYQSHVATAARLAGSKTAYYIATASDPNPTVQYGLTLDSTLKAESVADLATQLGMDADVLEATINRYNELCDKGVDEDFGKPAEYMQKIEGTVYAIPLNRSFTVTFDGLVTDLDSHVLDNNNNSIPGLYAAGEVSFTGLFGDEYPSCGLAIGASVRYGRIAGVNAATGK